MGLPPLCLSEEATLPKTAHADLSYSSKEALPQKLPANAPDFQWPTLGPTSTPKPITHMWGPSELGSRQLL